MSVDLLKCLLEGLQQQSLSIINISNITSASFNSSQHSRKKNREIFKNFVLVTTEIIIQTHHKKGEF
jgi:hypothetical protein